MLTAYYNYYYKRTSSLSVAEWPTGVQRSTGKEFLLCHTTPLDHHPRLTYLPPSLLCLSLSPCLCLPSPLSNLPFRYPHFSRTSKELRSFHVWPGLRCFHGDKRGASPNALNPVPCWNVSDVRSTHGQVWFQYTSRYRHWSVDLYFCYLSNSTCGKFEENN